MNFKYFYEFSQQIREILHETINLLNLETLGEALRVKDKGVNVIPIAERLAFEKWERTTSLKKRNIGKVSNVPIIRSGHLDTFRYDKELKGHMSFKIIEANPQYKLRGEGLSDEFLKSLIERAIEKYSLDTIKEEKLVMILYKNKDRLWDFISCAYSDNKILIITAVQKSKASPDKYTEKEKQFKMILESNKIQILILD